MTGNRSSSDLSSLGCLVVEDNAFTSIDICKSLDALGIKRVATASNGREALAKIDSMDFVPQVILLDLRMPVMGGVEMLSRLADLKYNGCVIIVSGVDEKTMQSVAELARQSNIRLTGSLPKPPDQQALSDLLAQCLD